MLAEANDFGVGGRDSKGRTAGFGGRSTGARWLVSGRMFSRLDSLGGNSDSEGALRLWIGRSVLDASFVLSLF